MGLARIAGPISSRTGTELAAKENPNQALNSAIRNLTLALSDKGNNTTRAGRAHKRRLRLHMRRQVIDVSRDRLVGDGAGDAELRDGRSGSAHEDCWCHGEVEDLPVGDLLYHQLDEQPLRHRPVKNPQPHRQQAADQAGGENNSRANNKMTNSESRNKGKATATQ